MIEQFASFALSKFGDVFAALTFIVLTVLVALNGKRFNQPWKLAMTAPMAFVAIYYISAVFDANRALMGSGFLRTSFVAYGLFHIAHLMRFDPDQWLKRIAGAFRK